MEGGLDPIRICNPSTNERTKLYEINRDVVWVFQVRGSWHLGMSSTESSEQGSNVKVTQLQRTEFNTKWSSRRLVEESVRPAVLLQRRFCFFFAFSKKR